MRTGICTTDFEHKNIPLRNAEDLFAKIHDYGFETVQLALSSFAETDFVPNGQIEIPPDIPYEIILIADRVTYRYHLPLRVMNGTFNMAHPDKEVREEGLRRFEQIVYAAYALACPYVSLCSGTRNREHLWSWSPENDTEEAWQDMYDTISRAVEMAEKRGIILAIESEASNIIDTPENARRIMDEIGSSHLKMILDCANLFHPGTAHSENVKPTIAHAVEVYGKDIVIAHGKDIREGDGIDFCGTGLGIVDFGYTAKLLRDIGYTGDMFLHGIYDEDDMPRALQHWKNCL